MTSIPLLDLNEEVNRLKSEKYNVAVIESNLVVFGIPYVNKDCKIKLGTIYCPIIQVADKVQQKDHTVRFVGEHPCNQFGVEEKSYVNSKQQHTLTPEIVGEYYFSSKPESGSYSNFYEKMTRYINLLSAPAKSIDASVDAKGFDFEYYYDDESPFCYPDSNSASSEIIHISRRLKGHKIGIVGLGGTGSYILDFVAKTYVSEITLFDGDELINKNAFRCPGPVTLDELKERPNKAEHYKAKYEKFRSGIQAHDDFLGEDNIHLLDGHDFVFIAIDNPRAKVKIIDFLANSNIPFIDVGMGLSERDNSIRGQLRTTFVMPENKSQLHKIQVDDIVEDDIYKKNIQIAELNALNASLAVIAWKKYYGFYSHTGIPLSNVFVVDSGGLAKSEA